MRKLLIFAANPNRSGHRRVDREVRDIEEGLNRTRNRDEFEIIKQWAVRPRDLRRAVVEEAPYIVHFTGHGDGAAGLYFEDTTGNPQMVSHKALASLFKLIAQRNQIECVFLNGCYSSVQAEAINQHVSYVVGVHQAVGNDAAIEFAVGFYDVIWAGESVEFAFNSGKVAVDMHLSSTEAIHLSGTDTLEDPFLLKESKSVTTLEETRDVVLLSTNLLGLEEKERRKREVVEIKDAIIRASLTVIERDQGLPIFKEPLHKSGIEINQLLQVLSETMPYVVDIAGLGDNLTDLMTEESFGATHCIVLNKCYVEKQAREIVQHIDFLVGIHRELSEDITTSFLSEFYYQIGKHMSINRAYDEACSRIRERVQDESRLPVLLSKRQEQQRKAREIELLTLDRKIREEPESANLRIRKGDILEEAGEHVQAASAYEKSLHIEGEDYKVWWKRGKALFKAGKYIEAKAPYEKALSLQPSFPDEYIISTEYGLTLSLAENHQKSIALYKKSLWLEPKYRVANYERKKVYRKLYSKKQAN